MIEKLLDIAWPISFSNFSQLYSQIVQQHLRFVSFYQVFPAYLNFSNVSSIQLLENPIPAPATRLSQKLSLGGTLGTESGITDPLVWKQ